MYHLRIEKLVPAKLSKWYHFGYIFKPKYVLLLRAYALAKSF